MNENYAFWKSNTHQFLTADYSNLVTADSSTLAWGTSYLLDSYCRAYNATGEEIYLSIPAGYIYQIFRLAADNDGDGYKCWGTGAYSKGKYDEFCVHVGCLLSTSGELINLIYSAPSILDKIEPVSNMTYRELCKYIIKEATENMIPAFDCDWNDLFGIYMNRPGSGNYDGATKEISLPNNQYLEMASALIQFAKLSPEHTKEYLYRAKAMLNAFRGKLNYDSDGNITAWNYKDEFFEGDWESHLEDYSHGMSDFRAAIMGYNNGLIFSSDDISAFAKRYETVMLCGTDDEPLLTQVVDGTGTKTNQLVLYIYDLTPFGTNIWNIGMKTAAYRKQFTTRDSARILIYHDKAPKPCEFALIGNNGNLFRWEVSVYSCKYTLQISDNEDFSNLIVNRDNILATSVFAEGIPEGKTLYWRVIAANQSGQSCVSDVLSVSSNFQLP
ncbi:MAG: hypothetical protein FWF15_10590 [Oscillospiraceae bacterium]|nr:hypothetical protein [Oscillospiraceae bacterium]